MIEIIDNFIHTEKQNELESNLIGNNGFPYFHSFDTVDSQYEQFLFDDKNIIHQPQFVHMLYADGEKSSTAFEYILDAFSHTQIKKLKPKRLKVNLLSPPITKNKNSYHLPHFDSPDSNDITFLYYVCDSDGDTYLFDQKYDENIPNKLTVKKRISPKKGRMIIFDSNNFHASSPPFCQDFRCVINMVFSKT